MKTCEWRNVEETKKAILSVLTPGKTLIVFDTETTGIGKTSESNNAKIIQFSAQKIHVNKDYSFDLIDEINVYVNQNLKIRPKIVEITGINEEFLQKYGKMESEASHYIFSFMDDADVVAGYNVEFDIMMLRFMSTRVRWLYDFMMPYIDVAEMARDMIPSKEVYSYKLGDVYNYLFLDNDIQFHNSSQDVAATVKIMEALLKRYLDGVSFDTPERLQKIRKFNVKSAKAWVNPHGGGRTHGRIRLTLTEGSGEDEHEVGKTGYVFFDRVTMRWSHQQNKAARELFEICDFRDIESQILKMRENRRFHSMSDLAKDRISFLNRKISSERKEKAT